VRRALIAFVLVLAGCTPDVIVGQNFAKDSGAEDGGGPFSGDGSVNFDAGVPDGGGGDGGAADGGAGDGGAGDGGAGDGGAGDGGAGDGGAGDAGFDAGSLGDGGPADLELTLTGDLVIDQLSVASYVARVANLGGSTAADASVRVTLPPGLALRSSVVCARAGDGGLLVCPVGDVPPGVTSTTAAFVLDTDAGPGWRDLTASVTTASLDVDAGNDSTTFFMAVTVPSALVFPVVSGFPRLVDITFCVGTGLTSFSQCTVSSYVTGSIELQSDGGLESDAGFYGQWGQSPHQRNLAFRFYYGTIVGSRFAGVATSASCFEGFIDSNGVYQRGVYQACLP